MDALEAIRKRRSVRTYTGEPIPREDLLQIVDAARWAATGYNRQPWDFVVAMDPATIAQLAAVAPWMVRAAAIVAVVVDPKAEYWLEDAAAAVENMLIAATALGYGTCWLEGRTKRHEPELKAMLGIPAEKQLFTLVPVGVPDGWPTQQKRSLDDVIHWEHY